jgi:formate-dependent phosphoribosylglycinamide formyltransferase (GAR transformylase)
MYVYWYGLQSVRLVVSPTYVHAIDISVCPLDLAYVPHLRSAFSFYLLKVQGMLRLTLKVLGFHLSSSTKGLG